MLNLVIAVAAASAFALGMIVFAISLSKEVKRHEKNKS
tara:strand:- start:89 stop:202 length:114 start_codon:yes stop_codon:yes gene_type:complete